MGYASWDSIPHLQNRKDALIILENNRTLYALTVHVYMYIEISVKKWRAIGKIYRPFCKIFKIYHFWQDRALKRLILSFLSNSIYLIRITIGNVVHEKWKTLNPSIGLVSVMQKKKPENTRVKNLESNRQIQEKV